MENNPIPLRFRIIRLGLPVMAIIILVFFFRSIATELAILIFGGAAVAFLLEPLARFYEKKFSRHLSALAALATVLISLLAAAWLLLPAMFRQFSILAEVLPDSVELVCSYVDRIAEWAASSFPGLTLPSPSLSTVTIPDLAAATFSAAGNFAGNIYRISLIIVLSYFFLCDRAKLMLRLELLVPASMRRLAVRMGNAVCRELKLYLRGQAMISLAVGSLSALGLAFVGVPSPLVLGALVGLLNMIPYFGPILGGIPAVLLALGKSWQTALAAVAVLWLVQQMDSTFISPRILGSLTGLSPAVVLIAIFAGSHFAGITGMLLALPVLMTFRTVFRVFVQRHENV